MGGGGGTVGAPAALAVLVGAFLAVAVAVLAVAFCRAAVSPLVALPVDADNEDVAITSASITCFISSPRYVATLFLTK